ncbi:MAG: RNA polymerase sigma-70 factor [Chitinophagaceae bacterium]
MRQQDLRNDMIADLKAGSTKAFDYFFRLFYGPLCLFAERILKERGAAQDIVEETFVKLWHKHTDFETALNIKAFLYITTRNACLNQLKLMQREKLTKKQLAYLSDDNQDFVLNEITRAEVLREIYQEIEKLPTQCRKIFKMSYLDGLKNHEIAEQMHISINTVKNQKVRALQLLKLRLFDKNLLAAIYICIHFL